jgi:aminocarboxymuconate-semialdehyde decarboxylase
MGSPVVDVHSHVYPESYLAGMSAAGHALAVPASFSDLDGKLAFMDRRGIDRALISVGNPWLEPLGAGGVDLAAALNRELAALATSSGGRLLGFGVLPHGSIETTAATAAAVAAEPGLYGLVSGTRICGLALDDRRLDPVWQALASTGLPLLVHPYHGLGGDGEAAPGSLRALALGFPLETTLALGRLVLAGVLHRFPGLRLVGAHCGGALPVLAGRLQAFWEVRATTEADVADPSRSLPRLAYDAVGYSPAAVRAAIELAGVEHVFFGTDHPFPVSASMANAAALEAALSGDELAACYGGAAEAFFALPPS